MVKPALKRSRSWQALFKRLVAPRGPVAPRQERLHPHPDRHPDVERATRDSQPIDMPNGSRVRIVGGLHPAGRRMSRPSKVVARCGALVKSRFFGSPARVSVGFACARAAQPTRSVERARAPQPPAALVGGGHLPVYALPHGLGRRPDARVRMVEGSGRTVVCRGTLALLRLASARSERIVGMATANAL
jgi:hypothetical protein